jgi:hypothetical protein
MLGTLNAKIYNIDTKEYDVEKWSQLENVRYFYDFFKTHEKEYKFLKNDYKEQFRNLDIM